MNAKVLTLSVLVLSALVAGVGQAHTKFYVQWNAQHVLRFALVDCGDGSDPVLNISGGGYCFGTKADGTLPDDFPTASDCVPAFSGPLDPTGECTVTTVDDLFSPILGSYCQDLNDDVFCGGAAGEPAAARTEPRVNFCDSITINTPIDLTPRAQGLWIGGPVSDPATTWVTNNWDPDSVILVFLGVITQGNPAVPGPCGAVVHQGTHGFGTHS